MQVNEAKNLSTDAGQVPASHAGAASVPYAWIVSTENRGAIPEHFRPYVILDETGKNVIARLPDGRGPQDKINARLLGAAPELYAALQIAADHLEQYRRYSEEMRKSGRGLMISSPYQEETADNIIAGALARARVI